MTNPAQQFKTVKKDRLFYDRFDYCLGFYLEEASCLRKLDHAHIDNLIKRKKQWREMAQQRWIKGQRSHGTVMSRRSKEITDQTQTDLHSLANVLLTTACDFKLVVSVNQGYVYTNDLDLIDLLDRMPELTWKTYTQAQINRAKNTIQLKKPRHEYRTYLRMIKLTSQQKQELLKFLTNQQSHVRVSPSLQKWLGESFNRSQDYFFVDHDSQNWLTMLSLVCPGIIRKTMHIVPAK